MRLAKISIKCLLPGKFEDEPNCGRPLGLRLDAEKYLVVLDAYKGLYRVNTVTGMQSLDLS